MANQGPSSRRGYLQPSTPSTTNLLSPRSGPSSQVATAQFIRPSLGVDPSPGSASLLRDSHSVSEKFSLSPDPSSWDTPVSPDNAEDDDELHTPDPSHYKDRNIFTARGFVNLGFLLVLLLAVLALFAGYPLISHFTRHHLTTQGGFNYGGVNESGQIPSLPGHRGLIDPDTPQDAYTKADYMNGQDWKLIFSDEFDVDGRTFWPGDDPYWEAVNLHYWQTGNLEWLDPTAITTRNGSLEITMSEKQNHNLNYTSGMMTTWNKFCFTGGMVEVSVSLPGMNNVVGLWPAIWTMGNLGRAGYGAALDGMWPYSYDSCDVGTAPNQTRDGQPVAATENGDPPAGGVLSYLPGQRLSRCSCPGSSHPGPMHEDGTYVGRSAPEIDIFEAVVSGQPPSGQVSQSAQWAPFDYEYRWDNASDNYVIQNSSRSVLNPYRGGTYQEASSCLTDTDQSAYEGNGGLYSVYGMQYQPGFDNAYITWISSGEIAWAIKESGLGANNITEISQRPIPQEPMYLIMNLGISLQFGGVIDFQQLTFPTTMRVDYVRVYQDPKNINYGCDPEDFPTEAYINEYIEAYTNPNLTTWRQDYGQPFPKNSFVETC